eukprot:185842_1
MCASHYPNGSKRNTCCNIIVIIFIILIHLALISLQIYIFIQNLTISSFNAVLNVSLDFAFTSLSMYYFYYNFQYPWHSINISIFSSKYGWYSRMMILASVLGVGLDICVLSLDLFYWSNTNLVTILNDVKYAFLFDIRMYLTFTVHTAICVKYQNHLQRLTYLLRQDNNSIVVDDILEKYTLLYKSYCIEYSSSLRYSLTCQLTGTVCWLWVNTYIFLDNINSQHIAWIINTAIYCCLMIFIYTKPAIFLNEQYHKFENELWHYQSMVSGQNLTIYSTKSYLLQFINKYRVAVMIGNFIVTKKNLILFLIVYAVSKYASFLVIVIQPRL